MYVIEMQKLFVKFVLVAESLVLPGRCVAVVFVVPLRLAFRCLILLAEVAAATLIAFEGVEA